MLPLVILGGALWYLSRPNRNPDWITVGGKHRPLRAGDGRSGDPTPYDPARVGETGTARATRTAASPGFEAPESEDELRGEAKRLYARYKQAHAAYEQAYRAYSELASQTSAYWSKEQEARSAITAAETKAFAAQEKASDAIWDASSDLSVEAFRAHGLNVRKNAGASWRGGLVSRRLMSKDDMRELVPDLQAFGKQIARALTLSDSQLASEMGLIPEARAQGAARRESLEKMRDKLPNAIRLAKLAVTAAGKAHEAIDAEAALTSDYVQLQESEHRARRVEEERRIETIEMQNRLSELTGHQVYDGVIHFESRASRADRLRRNKELTDQWRAKEEERQRQEAQAAQVKATAARASAEASERFRAELAAQRDAKRKRIQEQIMSVQARLAAAMEKNREAEVARLQERNRALRAQLARA